MSFPRPLLALVGGVLAIVLASLGGLAYLTLRTRPLAERLVREVDALERARHPRPSHVTRAAPGTFAEHVAPLMGDVVRLYREQPRALRTYNMGWPCLAVTEGREPVSKLPPACGEALEQGRALVARVLAATHAEEGGLPEGLGELASPKHPHTSSGRAALLHVVRLAALETRVQLEGGRAAEAVDTCVDALALSRELALGGGLGGHMGSATGYGVMYRPCAAALDAASAERKRVVVTQLSRLAEGFVPFSQAMREESASIQLSFFGGLLPAELLGALPVGVRDFVLSGPGVGPGTSIDARLSWRKTVKVFDALVSVADQGAEARRRGFAAVAAADEQALYRVDGPEVATYEHFADRAELQRFQHGALMALVEADLERTKTGRWPEQLTGRASQSVLLESTGPGEARLKPCTPAPTEHELRVTADTASGSWVRQAP